MDTDTWVVKPETYAARIEGRCLCGAVHWSYDASFAGMLNCHCSICRKHHGTLFATFVAGPLHSFRWRGDTQEIATWQSSTRGRRSYCRICGSKVAVVDTDSQQVFMAAGNLTGELGIRPQLDLFVGSKAPWHTLTDSLPKHDAYPPEWGMTAVESVPRPVRAGFTCGSCACGKMRFELDGRPIRMHHCHCSRCRQARGTAHATNVIYQLEALRHTAGEELLVDFNLPGAEFFGTSFCRSCGGAMPRRSPARGVVVVPVGTLDSDPQIHALAHQFVGSKAPWFEITDGVPQFAEAAPRV